MGEHPTSFDVGLCRVSTAIWIRDIEFQKFDGSPLKPNWCPMDLIHIYMCVDLFIYPMYRFILAYIPAWLHSYVHTYIYTTFLSTRHKPIIK